MARKTNIQDRNEAIGAPSEADKKAAPPKSRIQARRAKRSMRSRPKHGTRKATARGRRGIRYSEAERQKILTTAKREGLTGAQVRDRFGVSTLTYYTWRKKARPSRARRRVLENQDGGGDVTGQIRDAIRAKVREMMPRIIEQEVGAALSSQVRRGR